MNDKKNQYQSLPKNESATSKKKKIYIQEIKKKKVDVSLTEKDLVHCLQAIRGLTSEEVKKNSKYLRELLKTWFNKHYASAHGALAENLRRAICWVDEALYKKGSGENL